MIMAGAGKLHGMARHPRLLFEGAIYHVIFRGVGRQRLFLNDSDYERLLRREMANLPAEDILMEICKEFMIGREGLKRRSRKGWQRPLTAYLLQKHGGLTQREIAGILGLKTGSAVSVQIRQFKIALMRQRDCSHAQARIERRLAC